MPSDPSCETTSVQIQADDLFREYARLTPLAHLQFSPTPPEAFNRVHNVLLNEILLDPHLCIYPPAPEYQLKFWKWAILGLEPLLDEDTEIDARIYDRLVELIQSTSSSQLPTKELAPPSPSYVTHYLRLCPESQNTLHRVTLLESRTTIEQGTTGLRTWPAAHALAEWLGTHSEYVRGMRVLELGCGVGYLGLVVATIQLNASDLEISQSSVWLTDVNDVVLSRCRENLNLPCNASSQHRHVEFKQLDWFSSLDTDGASSVHEMMAEADPDLLFGADVVYDPHLIPPLIATLHLAISAKKSTREHPASALLALTVRRPETFCQFLEAAEQSFVVTTIYTSTTKIELGGRGSYTEQEIVIIRLDTRN